MKLPFFLALRHCFLSSLNSEKPVDGVIRILRGKAKIEGESGAHQKAASSDHVVV